MIPRAHLLLSRCPLSTGPVSCANPSADLDGAGASADQKQLLIAEVHEPRHHLVQSQALEEAS